MRAALGSALCLAIGAADLIALHVAIVPRAIAGERLAFSRMPVAEPVAVAVAVPEAEPEPESDPEPEPESDPESESESEPDPVAVPDSAAPLASLYFATDRATIYPAAASHLSTVADRLTRDPSLRLAVIGYADAPGDPDHNLALSQRRVRRVIDALVDRGIDSARLDRVARGERGTAGDHSSRRDRRVDLIALEPR